jgi:glycosyltransferase involved in cell wall biosynthesis
VRVAVISDSRRKGGAALATARMFDELALTGNFDVRWFVSQSDGSQDDRTVVFAGGGVVRRSVATLTGWLKPIRRRLLRVWARGRNRRCLLRLVREFEPTVISLHSLNEWTDAALRRTIACDLAKIAPVVWTLHDMWPLTGYSDYSDEYVDPAVSEKEAFERVFGKASVREEACRVALCGSRLVWVAPSRWIGELATKAFEGALRVVHIPHGVNVRDFRPLPQDEACRFLDIPTDRPVVVAAAHSLRARRKGISYLAEALARLDKPVTVALMGHARTEIKWPEKVRPMYLGYLGDARLLRAAYAAGDVFVVPSLAEMFGLVVIEAMACGTPCVGFRTGGISEIIRPGITGELARRGDAADLACAIKKVLDVSVQKKEEMRAACRRVVEENYDLALEAGRYAELFSELATKG